MYSEYVVSTHVSLDHGLEVLRARSDGAERVLRVLQIGRVGGQVPQVV